MDVTPSHVAGIIAGDGTLSGGKIKGVAPQSQLVGVKVLDRKGNGKLTAMLDGIEWILNQRKRLGIHLVNISVGTTGRQQGEHSELVKAVNRLWDAGLVVCAAAGNEGSTGMHITSPGVSRKTITVGSYDDIFMVDDNGRRYEHYSGKGPTAACICKPEIVAPGTSIISTNVRRKAGDFPYTVKSGTSMSTPIVTGALALLAEKFPEMTNTNMKLRLRECAVDMKLPPNHQGWGRINIKRLLEGCI